MDAVFKALADPTRRQLLEKLRLRNGQTLLSLCGPIGLSRPAVAKHLKLLEKAGLIGVQWKGREKWHYLQTGPLFELQDRWLKRFKDPGAMLGEELNRALKRR